jgi:hypothetical protein
MNAGQHVTDTIPRARLRQILDALAAVSMMGGCTFDEVRGFLSRRSKTTSLTPFAMATVARDVLSDLNRLQLVHIGPIPRKRSELEQRKHAKCEITDDGAKLAELYRATPGQAFDRLLLSWINEHPYFRLFILRVMQSPLFIPTVTSVKQFDRKLLANSNSSEIIQQIAANCVNRLIRASTPAAKISAFKEFFQEKMNELWHHRLSELDAKTLIDAIENRAVLPALLKAENLPFDAVTFERLLWAARDFLCAASISSHPDFSGNVVFATSCFKPDLLANPDAPAVSVTHRGYTFTRETFQERFTEAYRSVAGQSRAFIDIYALRAIVCLSLKIQPKVFNKCLESLANDSARSHQTIFFELPFKPPPKGELYVQVGNQRIGQVNISE